MLEFFYDKQVKHENIIRLQNILDIADSNSIANILVHSEKGKGYYVYKRWRKKIERILDDKRGIKRVIQTVWDRVKRKRKRRVNVIN